MNLQVEIPKTKTFQDLVYKTPFLKKILLKKSVTDSIQRIIYQIEKLGEEYISDKGYPGREVKIAKEIIENSK